MVCFCQGHLICAPLIWSHFPKATVYRRKTVKARTELKLLTSFTGVISNNTVRLKVKSVLPVRQTEHSEYSRRRARDTRKLKFHFRRGKFESLPSFLIGYFTSLGNKTRWLKEDLLRTSEVFTPSMNENVYGRARAAKLVSFTFMSTFCFGHITR